MRPPKTMPLAPLETGTALALVVEPLADTQPRWSGSTHHLHAVEPVAFRVVPRGIAVAGDLTQVWGAIAVSLVDQEGGA
jgi:hypothetical protein